MQAIRYAALGLYLGFLKMKRSVSGEYAVYVLLGPPEKCCGFYCCKNKQSMRLHKFSALLKQGCSAALLPSQLLCYLTDALYLPTSVPFSCFTL